MYNSVMTKTGKTLFAERLKSARIAAGLTQQSLADKVGITLRGYCRWESGQTEPSFGTVVEVCRILDVTSDYLLGLADEARAD